MPENTCDIFNDVIPLSGGDICIDFTRQLFSSVEM
jgi:hypothetical protein